MPRYPIIAALAAALLGGCMSDNVSPRQGIGTLTGAVGGAFLGEKVGKGRGRVLATAVGTLAGAAVGSDIGRSLDRANAAYTTRVPAAHSQQTPVPGFAPPQQPGDTRHYRLTSQNGDASAGTMIRDAQDCRALDEGNLRPSYACRNKLGQWFVLQ